MASTIGHWNPAWGPEPQWQGPAKKAPPKRKPRWYRVSCPCSSDEYMVRHPGVPIYVCVRCGATMHAVRIQRKPKPRVTTIHSGERYGRLVVEEVIRGGNLGKTDVRCRCDCGEVKVIAARHLREGRTKSCGCLRREVPSASHPWRRSYKTQQST